MNHLARYSVLFIAPYHGLAEQVERVAPRYPDLSVTVHEGDLSQGLATALGSMGADYDVLISRGGTAQLLEDEFALPVIEVGISVADFYECLIAHNPKGRRTAVVGFENAIGPLSEVARFSDFDLDLHGIAFEDELPLVLQTVVEGSYPVVLCDTFSLPRCRDLGLNAFLLESGEASVSAALDQALVFCQRTHDLLAKNRMLWNLVRAQDARFAVFSAEGRITYSNLEEGRDDLVAFMRQHLTGMADERLVLQRGRRLFRLHKTPVESDGRRFLAFSVTQANAPSNSSHAGIERSNRAEVEASYEKSAFHTTRASEDLAQLVAGVQRGTKPLLLLGEPCSGKEQIAQLLYLSSPLSTRPYVTVDCPLVTEKSWAYLADSPNSPLYAGECTLFFNSLQALGEERMRQLLDIVRRTRMVERNRLMVSMESTDSPDPKTMEILYESLRFSIVRVPPMRERGDLGRAITLLLTATCEEVGTPRLMLTDEALDILVHYSWPGNYEELHLTLQQCVAAAEGGAIGAEAVRGIIAQGGGLGAGAPSNAWGTDVMRPLREVEQDVIREVIRRCGNNQTEAARVLGISRTTIWRLLG